RARRQKMRPERSVEAEYARDELIGAGSLAKGPLDMSDALAIGHFQPAADRSVTIDQRETDLDSLERPVAVIDDLHRDATRQRDPGGAGHGGRRHRQNGLWRSR